MPSRIFRPAYPAPSSPPGTLTARPARTVALVTVRIATYDAAELREETLADPTPDDIAALTVGPGVTWVDVQGLHDLDVLMAVAQRFGLHHLSLEDVLAVAVRPKLAVYPTYTFALCRRPVLGDIVTTEQVSLFLLHDAVVSLNDAPDDVFGPVRERLRRPTGNLRSSGADYLTYALVDSLVDQYYPVLEAIGERLEDLEAELLENPEPSVIFDIRHVKGDLLTVRRAIWPLREVVSGLQADTGDVIGDAVAPFLLNCYDHTVEVLEVVEIYREVAGGLTDVYLASVNNRMSEIMKVLTLMATIFIPLTFIAGVYGMNFNTSAGPYNMPELGWRWGYPGVLLLMAGIAGALLVYFRHRHWL